IRTERQAMTASRPLDIVTRFLSLVNRSLIDKAMDLLADNVFYHNVPLEPIVGRETVRAFTHALGMGTRLRPDWELLAIGWLADKLGRASGREGGREYV